MTFFKINYHWDGETITSLVYPGIHHASPNYKVTMPDGSMMMLEMRPNNSWSQVGSEPNKLSKLIGKAIEEHYSKF